MSNLLHLIITRYNLSLFSDNAYNIPNPDQWMEERFELFTRFTLPSMKAQIRKNYTWFVFLDPNTPPHYKHQLEDIAFDNMQIVSTKTPQLRFLQEKIASSKNTDIVITSRIDNDDAWHENMVNLIQTKYNKPTKLLGFMPSYWLDYTTGRLFHHNWRWYYILNPKIGNNPTFVEWKNTAKTIQIDTHPNLIKHIRRHQYNPVSNVTYRLIVCHGKNVANQIQKIQKKSHPISPKILKPFNINWP